MGNSISPVQRQNSKTGKLVIWGLPIPKFVFRTCNLFVMSTYLLCLGILYHPSGTWGNLFQPQNGQKHAQNIMFPLSQPKASSKGPSHRKILYANFLPCRPISSLTRHSMSLQKNTHCITNLGTSAPPSQPQNSQRHAQNTTFVKIRPTRPIVAQILNFIEFT